MTMSLNDDKLPFARLISKAEQSVDQKREAILESNLEGTQNKEAHDLLLKQMSSLMSMQTPKYDPKKSVMSQSVDMNSFKDFLGSQRNRFQDLLVFGDKSKPVKVPISRVRDNEILDEIHQKLMDPSLKTEML